MIASFQVFSDPYGNLWVADGTVTQPKTGVRLPAGSGADFSPLLTQAWDGFAPATACGGGTFVGGSGRGLVSSGLSGSGSGPALPVGIWRPTRPNVFVLGAFVLTVSGSSSATISDGTNTVANLTTGGTAPVGSYVATSYGQSTYNGGSAFTLAVVTEQGAPGTIQGYSGSVSDGTAYVGSFTPTTAVAWQGATDAAWTAVVNSDGTADLKHSGTMYEANSTGMAAYNSGAAWRAYLRVVPVAARAGFIFLAVTETSGVLTAVAGPLLATALPADGGGVYHVALAHSDGLGGVLQLQAGTLAWDSPSTTVYSTTTIDKTSRNLFILGI